MLLNLKMQDREIKAQRLIGVANGFLASGLVALMAGCFSLAGAEILAAICFRCWASSIMEDHS